MLIKTIRHKVVNILQYVGTIVRMPKTSRTKRSPKSSRSLIRLIFIIGLVLFVASGWIWWKEIYNDPRKVFQDMLGRTMSTRSVVKRVQQQNAVQSLDQHSKFQSGSTYLVHSTNKLGQANSQSKVTTESISTLTEDYVRYTEIQTDQKGESGNTLDFSNLLGVWSKAQGTGDQISEIMLSVVPFGFVPQDNRSEIVKFINDNKVYDVDYDNVERTSHNGRAVYSYTVAIKASPYIEMLKRFGRAVGLTQLESVDSESYSNSPPLQFKLVVDVQSRELVKVEYVDSGRVEEYLGYGLNLPTALPEETISVEDLQNRLQSIR